jgi:hypothetical protein
MATCGGRNMSWSKRTQNKYILSVVASEGLSCSLKPIVFWLGYVRGVVSYIVHAVGRTKDAYDSAKTKESDGNIAKSRGKGNGR